jgi:hypothetical protein
MQGLSLLMPDGQFQLCADFDVITELPQTREHELSFGGSVVSSPQWREWTLPYDNDQGELTMFEHQPDLRAGFHLDIIKAISDVWWPVVERSRGSSIVVHSDEDPEMRRFDSLEAVADWAVGGN